MGFKPTRRRGQYWDDAHALHEFLCGFPFHTTGRKEHDFETGFGTAMLASQKQFKSQVITQIDKTTTVQSVHCFGKKHRPDITLDESGIAIEIKYITYDGLKEAIGQGFLYRMRYRFVFLVLVVSEERKVIYDDLHAAKEKDLEDSLSYLAGQLNIFTYIVPAFSLKPGVRKCFAFFEDAPTT